MTRIKIVSNPYNRSLSYYVFKEQLGTWENIDEESINSKLRENDEEKIFLPFKVKEIVDTIISEYYVGTEKVELIFEGTADEYEELLNVCTDDDVKEKVALKRSVVILENARDILDHAKDIFETVHPIIKNIVKDDPMISKGLVKVSDALKDIIPICIFGNYSAGKSTFINSLVGYEILPSGGDPVTSKIYEIKRSGQEDRGKISFSYRDEEYELLFDNKECRLTIGDKDKDLIVEVLEAIGNLEELSLFRMVNKTIEILNSFEKRDKTTTLISNVIRIEIPFSENGKLGQSHNEFVIFDTPGSNSNTNMDHEKVLTDSLEGFSNGIPIWVSGYDSIDSVDNANLCDKLYKIEALDKRFTMIVINKADSVELPKNGLGNDEINNIMEYESVEKMYSSGIYFVSSVMGLGAKNPEGILSEYLLDVYDEKQRKFSDPSARGYKKLYEYNIMPEQMKKRALEYSKACENIIYANSGIYCVEMEMEQFASRHAAYNKCQMVYMFLKSIIDETDRRIAVKTEMIEKSKLRREQELDQKKYFLLESIRRDTQSMVKRFEKETKSSIHKYVKDSLSYEILQEDIDEIDQILAEKHESAANYSAYENDFQGARDTRVQHFFENIKNSFKGNFIEQIKNIATEWANDSETLQIKKDLMDSTRQSVDKEISDKLLASVVEDFKRSIMEAQWKLGETSQSNWQRNAQEYRDEMVRLITGTDALSEQQRNELSDVILSYPTFQYDDGADKVFIKAKFLRGNILGLRFGDSERLNTKRLSSSYNSKMKTNISEMTELINNSCFTCFKAWQENLQATIEENITLYNPELRELTEFIKDESERILELQTNQQTISNSFKTMENMMAWKELE